MELNGQADKKNRTIKLKESCIADTKPNRRNVLYHEIGHLLFGFPAEYGEKQRALFAKMAELMRNNPNVLTKRPEQYVLGIQLLEEYIVEKFAIQAKHYSLNTPIPNHKNCRHTISGSYSYDTTFESGYGLIESVCDKLIGKRYRNFDGILRDCLSSDFYEKLLDNYDGVEMMQILGELGYVHSSMLAWAQKREVVSPTETESSMKRLSNMVSTIHLNRSQASNDSFDK